MPIHPRRPLHPLPRRPVVAAAALALALTLLAGACHSGGSPATPVSPSSGVSVPAGSSYLDPHGELSRDPATLAADLTLTTARLRAALRGWTDLGAPPPEDVQLLALHQQRLYGLLSGSPDLAASTLSLLSGPLAREARANVEAGASLRSTITPSAHPPDFRTAPPDPAAELRAAYDEAQARFGVAWQVLAAVNFVETRFDRVRSPSSASARGPMQFIGPTWKAYGLGGNVLDPHDAILGAANYLAASGAPGDYRGALWHYNPSKSYVKAVWLYAKQMMRDPASFLVYYNWQVFVITTKGDVQLTGPGSAG